MSFLFGGVPEFKPPPVPIPKGQDEAAANAANAERLRRSRAMGYSQTVLTEGLGNAPVRRKTLLGQ